MGRSVQIFGTKKSQATRAAERFFKERSVQVHFVDLHVKPLAPGELRRFIERFTLQGLLDKEGKAYTASGLKYINMTEAGLLGKIEAEPGLLRLPLVRGANRVSIGSDPAAWLAMVEAMPKA